MPDPARVVEMAMRLRGESPETWNEFVMAVREYSATMMADMLKHSPETLLRAQGAAIAMAEIAATLNNAPQLYERTKERKQHGR
jgi:hypothetical protein